MWNKRTGNKTAVCGYFIFVFQRGFLISPTQGPTVIQVLLYFLAELIVIDTTQKVCGTKYLHKEAL